MNKKLTSKDFIKKSIEIHSNRYDYSLVEYVNNHTKIKIVCSKHGIFYQRPYDHLSKHGCPKCANLLGFEKFIEKSIKYMVINMTIQWLNI